MVSAESLLLLISAFATGRLLRLEFLSPLVKPVGNILIIHVIGFLAFLVYLWLDQPSRKKRYALHRFGIALICSLMIIGIIASRETQFRNSLPKPVAWNDGALQTQAAATLILDGANPYAADYHHTIFSSFFRDRPLGADSGALTHYAYPPLIPILSIPTMWINQTFDTHLDGQILYLYVFFLLVAILCLAARTWERRTTIVLLTLANPFVWMYPLAGWNDIIFITAIVGSAILIERKHWLSAGIIFGLALAAKQTAWLTVPLWLYWLWRHGRSHPIEKKKIQQAILAAGMTAGAIYIPFILWNGPALYDDIVRYVSGVLPNTFPIQGITFLQYLRVWGVIDSPWTRTPTWIFELFFGLPTLWLVSQWLKNDLMASRWIFASTIFILVVTLFNRFGGENYYAAIFLLAVAAYVLQPHEPESS